MNVYELEWIALYKVLALHLDASGRGVVTTQARRLMRTGRRTIAARVDLYEIVPIDVRSALPENELNYEELSQYVRTIIPPEYLADYDAYHRADRTESRLYAGVPGFGSSRGTETNPYEGRTIYL